MEQTEQIYMKHPPTGEVRSVDVDKIEPLMVLGWQQCAAPEPPPTAAKGA